MHAQEKDARPDIGKSSGSIVRRVMVCSALLLIVCAAGGYFLQGWIFVQSLLIGGLLVNGSFWLMQRDMCRLVQRAGELESGASINSEKARFFLRTFARLVVVGLLLFVLTSRIPIDAVGLIVGCVTVTVSVVIVGLSAGSVDPPDKKARRNRLWNIRYSSSR